MRVPGLVGTISLDAHFPKTLLRIGGPVSSDPAGGPPDMTKGFSMTKGGFA